MNIKHLLTFNTIIISTILFAQDKGVGIGTEFPQETLHVKGSLRLEHPSQSEGYLLQVFGEGSMKWSPMIPKSTSGVVGNDIGHTGDIPTDTYLNGYITLSPGQWLVKVSLLIPTNYNANAQNNDPDSSLVYSDLIIKVLTHFSESDTDPTRTYDYIEGSAKNITGSLITPSMYGMVEGYAILNNSSREDKTYYLWGRSDRFATTSNPNALSLFQIGGDWSENRIYSIPISTN